MIDLHFQEDTGTLETLQLWSPTHNCSVQFTSTRTFTGYIDTGMKCTVIKNNSIQILSAYVFISFYGHVLYDIEM